MTQQEELALYKAALVDWEKPFTWFDSTVKRTAFGFCCYFKKIHDLDVYGYVDRKEDIPYIFKALPTLCKFKESDGAYLWLGQGEFEEGRAARVNALKKAINELETILNQTKQ